MLSHCPTCEFGNRVIQPIEQISEIVRKHQAFFHVDCVQSFAKLPLGKIAASCDGLSVSSHKVYGQKGLGPSFSRPSIS